MLRENMAIKRAMRRAKVLGFYHVENGQTLSDEALTNLARSESFAFACTSRFYNHIAPVIRPAYEKAFVVVYNDVVSHYSAMKNVQQQ